MRRLLTLTAAAAACLLLAGCSQEVNGLSSDKATETAITYLLSSTEEQCAMEAGKDADWIAQCQSNSRKAEERADSRNDVQQGTKRESMTGDPTGHSVEAWHAGVVVIVEYQLKESPDPSYEMFSVVAEGDDYKIEDFHAIDASELDQHPQCLYFAEMGDPSC